MNDIRIGFGYDSHRFEAGRRLVLGGVEDVAPGLGYAGQDLAPVAVPRPQGVEHRLRAGHGLQPPVKMVHLPHRFPHAVVVASDDSADA